MTEESNEKTEKIQLEGVVKEDKVIVSDERGIEEFYNTSYIGTIEQDSQEQDILIFDSMETLLLIERHRILVWEDNDKSKQIYDFEGLLTYFTKFDDRFSKLFSNYTS